MKIQSQFCPNELCDFKEILKFCRSKMWIITTPTQLRIRWVNINKTLKMVFSIWITLSTFFPIDIGTVPGTEYILNKCYYYYYNHVFILCLS